MNLVFALWLLTADGVWRKIADYDYSAGPAVCRDWDRFGGEATKCIVETKV